MSCCLLETITGNTATPLGGGIDCYVNSSPTITNNTITGNTATAVGGGIECYNNSSPTITNNTITGNMGNIGTAASYDVRCSTSEITTQEIWGAATQLTGEPAPQVAGTVQSMTAPLTDLPADTRVYFGIRTTNADANVSGLSNSPYIDTPAAPLPLAKQQMLPGDANGDCSVNLLDIVFISQRLGQDVGTADNRRADVTGDGRIDVMDQVLVRKHLGAECR